MKCSICKETIERTFLGKFRGTYIGRYKDKKLICSKCQKRLEKKS